MRRLGRWLLCAGLVAASCAVVWPIVARWSTSIVKAPRPDAIRPQLRELVAALGPRRIFEPRLTGGFTHGPLASGAGDATGEGFKLPPAVRLAIARLEQAQSHESQGLASVAVAWLIQGDFDRAVNALESVSRASTAPAAWLSDLAAAYLIRSRHSARGDDLLRALDAADRALARDPALHEALFNRALALEANGLRDAASDAWRRYVESDSNSAWTADARERLARSTSPAREEVWEHSRVRLLKLDDRLDVAFADACVTAFPQATREFVQDELWPTWARAVQADDSRQAEKLLATIIALSSAHANGTGDRFLDDAARALRGGRSERRTLSQAHLAFAEARRLYSDDKFLLAGRRFAEARVLFVRARSPFVTWADLEHAVVSFQRRDVHDAAEKLENVLAAATASYHQALKARSVWLLGMIAWHRARYESALASYQRAAETYASIREWENRANVASVRADNLRQLGDYRGGWTTLIEALRVLPQLRAPIKRYLLLFNASLFALSLDCTAAALTFQQLAVAQASQLSNPGPVSEALVRRAVILLQLGRHDEAARSIGDARRQLEKLTDPIVMGYIKAELDSVEAQFLSSRDSVRARSLLASAIAFFQRDEPSELPSLFLRRGRIERDVGRTAEAETAFRHGIHLLEQRREAVSSSQLRLGVLTPSGDLFPDLTHLLVDADRSGEAFQIVERSKLATLESAPVDVQQAQRVLRPNELLVQFAVLSNRTLAWAITAESFHLHTIDVNRSELAAAVTQYAAAVSAHPAAADAALRESRALYRLLIAPLQERARRDGLVIIVADDVLHWVPWAHLQDARSGRFLVQDHALALATSVTSLVRARRAQRHVTTSPRALTVGEPSVDPALFPALGRLPMAHTEAREVLRVHGQGTMLAGDEATVSRFAALAGQHEIVHFAGHAVANVDAPDLSFLLFAPDPRIAASGMLTWDGIRRLNLRHTRLVTLAACSTAKGPTLRGVGVLNLAHGFLLAGVPVVVATLWDVDDANSSRLVRQFHQNVARGLEPAHALRLAQLDQIGHQSGVAPGVEWAAFVVIGDPGSLDKTAASKQRASS